MINQSEWNIILHQAESVCVWTYRDSAFAHLGMILTLGSVGQHEVRGSSGWHKWSLDAVKLLTYCRRISKMGTQKYWISSMHMSYSPTHTLRSLRGPRRFSLARIEEAISLKWDLLAVQLKTNIFTHTYINAHTQRGLSVPVSFNSIQVFR